MFFLYANKYNTHLSYRVDQITDTMKMLLLMAQGTRSNGSGKLTKYHSLAIAGKRGSKIRAIFRMSNP
jgi:hypothetical protein